MSPRIFANSPAKDIVRGEWDKPILEHVYRKSNRKYLYLGLPGKDLLDINSWQKMIGHVIAFERQNLAWLVERGLVRLKIPHTVYTGILERVIEQGEDLDGEVYNQEEIITLYNLDFCDHISKRIGRQIMTTKLEAIEGLLAHQRSAYMKDGRMDKFILLITLRIGYHLEIIQNYINNDISAEARSFISQHISDALNSTENMECEHNILKAFVCDSLTDLFTANNITYYFLPLIHYFGGSDRATSFVHFTVHCKINPLSDSSPPTIQNKADFLKLKSFLVNNGDITIDEHDGEVEELGPSPSEIMSSIDGIIFPT